MSDVKINASFILPGSVLPAECPRLKKEGKKKEKEKENEGISYRQEKIHMPKGQSFVINLREGKPVQQVLHLTYEAYEYMIANENPVQGITTFHWKSYSKNRRIKAHLQMIAENLGGQLDSFTILED